MWLVIRVRVFSDTEDEEAESSQVAGGLGVVVGRRRKSRKKGELEKAVTSYATISEFGA